MGLVLSQIQDTRLKEPKYLLGDILSYYVPVRLVELGREPIRSWGFTAVNGENSLFNILWVRHSREVIIHLVCHLPREQIMDAREVAHRFRGKNILVVSGNDLGDVTVFEEFRSMGFPNNNKRVLHLSCSSGRMKETRVSITIFQPLDSASL